MSKPKIKFKLIKLERALVFQVLEQDERFRCGKDSISITYYACNGVIVSSACGPGLEGDEICLRGDMPEHDHLPATISFKSNDERDAYATKLLEALRDWSQNAPQFAEDKAAPKTTEPDTYEF